MAHLLQRLALAALADHPADAQQAADPWVGKRVITTYGTVLMDGNTVVDDAGRSENFAASGRDRRSLRIYRVDQVNGPWLLLVAEKSGVKGWAPAENVIPFDQAIDYFTIQIRANPNASNNYVNRAVIWDEKGELDIAIGDYNDAIRLDPRNEVAYVARSNAWSAKKEYDKAVADYSEAIRLDPKYALAYNNRGNAWSAKKEYDKAVADYNEAIRLDPKYANAYNGRAWLWATCPDAKQRDGKRAVESATRACELSDWKKPNDLDTLAAAYAEAGDFAKAVEWQTKAIGLQTDEKAKDDYRTRLKLYQENKPYRTSE